MWAKVGKFFGLIAIVGLGAGITWITIPKSHQTEQTKTQAVPIVAVETVRLEPIESWESKMQFNGVVKAKQRSDLSFERMGRVERVSVEQGEKVQAGQVLAKLNTDLIDAQMRKLAADKAAAKAGLDEMIAGPRQEVIDAAKATVLELDTQLKLAKQLYDRRQRLLNNGATSKEDLEQSEMTVQKIQASRIVAQKTLDDLELGTRKEKIAMQQATIESLDEMISAAKIELRYCQLTAPYSGTIVQRNIHEGVVVQPGVPVFIISGDNELEAQFGVPPSMLPSLNVGQSLVVQVRGQAIDAKLKSINPQIDDETRTLRIVATLHPNEETRVLPGDIASLELFRNQKTSGFWLPLSAVLQGQRGLWECLVVESETSEGTGKIAIRQVEILHTDTDRVLVRGTLKANDAVVASAVNRLVRGQTVALVNHKSEQNSTLVSEQVQVTQ